MMWASWGGEWTDGSSGSEGWAEGCLGTEREVRSEGV